MNALSKRETAAGKQTTEAYCKNAAAKMDLTGKVFDVDVVEINVRKQKMDIPGLFSVVTGNMLCSLGRARTSMRCQSVWCAVESCRK